MLVLPDFAQQGFFFFSFNGISGDLPLQGAHPFKVGIDVQFREALLHPVFEVGVFAFVDVGIVGGKLIDVLAIVIHPLQNAELHLIGQLLHGQQVVRFVRQQGIGEIGEDLQFVAHSNQLFTIVQNSGRGAPMWLPL